MSLFYIHIIIIIINIIVSEQVRWSSLTLTFRCRTQYVFELALVKHNQAEYVVSVHRLYFDLYLVW